MRRLLILCILPLALMPRPAIARIEEDAQVWSTITATGPVTGRLLVSGEVVARASNDQNRIYEAEMTAMLGYRVSRSIDLLAGFTRVPSYHGGRPTTFENRFREQAMVELSHVAGGRIRARSLVEERTVQGKAGTGIRLRQQVKWLRPFHRKGRTALVLMHESFVSLNSTGWGQASGYNRMRNFVGISQRLATGVQAELGYLNQYDFRRNAPDRMAHAAVLTLTYLF